MIQWWCFEVITNYFYFLLQSKGQNSPFRDRVGSNRFPERLRPRLINTQLMIICSFFSNTFASTFFIMFIFFDTHLHYYISQLFLWFIILSLLWQTFCRTAILFYYLIFYLFHASLIIFYSLALILLLEFIIIELFYHFSFLISYHSSSMTKPLAKALPNHIMIIQVKFCTDLWVVVS